MEKLSIADLPKGTTEALEELAIKAKFVKTTGKANISAFLRHKIKNMVKK